MRWKLGFSLSASIYKRSIAGVFVPAITLFQAALIYLRYLMTSYEAGSNGVKENLSCCVLMQAQLISKYLTRTGLGARQAEGGSQKGLQGGERQPQFA